MLSEEKIEELAAEELAWRRSQHNPDPLDAEHESLHLDGTHDHYLGEFFSLSDSDVERLEGYYYAGDLSPTLSRAWVKAAANLPG